MLDKASKILESVELKKTKIRVELINTLLNANKLYSAQELYLLLVQSDTNVNLSTIYRTLEKLVEHNVINQINLDNQKQALYEYAHDHHHHFLVCDTCNEVTVIHNCPVEGYGKQLENEYGFDVKSHKIEYYGTCSNCQK